MTKGLLQYQPETWPGEVVAARTHLMRPRRQLPTRWCLLQHSVLHTNRVRPYVCSRSGIAEWEQKGLADEIDEAVAAQSLQPDLRQSIAVGWQLCASLYERLLTEIRVS
jgi:hypothetical protein